MVVKRQCIQIIMCSFMLPASAIFPSFVSKQEVVSLQFKKLSFAFTHTITYLAWWQNKNNEGLSYRIYYVRGGREKLNFDSINILLVFQYFLAFYEYTYGTETFIQLLFFCDIFYSLHEKIIMSYFEKKYYESTNKNFCAIHRLFNQCLHNI